MALLKRITTLIQFSADYVRKVYVDFKYNPQKKITELKDFYIDEEDNEVTLLSKVTYRNSLVTVVELYLNGQKVSTANLSYTGNIVTIDIDFSSIPTGSKMSFLTRNDAGLPQPNRVFNYDEFLISTEKRKIVIEFQNDKPKTVTVHDESSIGDYESLYTMSYSFSPSEIKVTDDIGESKTTSTYSNFDKTLCPIVDHKNLFIIRNASILPLYGIWVDQNVFSRYNYQKYRYSSLSGISKYRNVITNGRLTQRDITHVPPIGLPRVFRDVYTFY